MTLLALLRHGPTEWNQSGLVQGRRDVPLSADGRARVAAWRLPEELGDFRWISSPLSRAVETARLLTGRAPQTDPRLVEMDWAVWEGRTLPDLRAELGNLMTAWEAEGLDFRAPGGESPREVQARLRPFLAEVAAEDAPTAVVCHKGVIRALYALAVGWDMTVKPPIRLHDDCVHLFSLARDGTPRPQALNIALLQTPGTPVAQ